MSADNGVYVLITAAPQSESKQFRVAYASESEIDEAFMNPDYGIRDRKDVETGTEHIDGLNATGVIAVFRHAYVFDDRGQALCKAHDIDNDNETEYGVRELDYSHVAFPAS